MLHMLTFDAIASREEESAVYFYLSPIGCNGTLTSSSSTTINKSSSNNNTNNENNNINVISNSAKVLSQNIIAPEDCCPICGDKTSGYHYGLQTCESCKGFFKRTVQNKKVYSCVDNQNCPIDKTQRKRCPYCRFQKCLNVGMKLEAVRADRMRGGRNKFGPMYKRDRALRQQALRQREQVICQYPNNQTPIQQHHRQRQPPCSEAPYISQELHTPSSISPPLVNDNSPPDIKPDLTQIYNPAMPNLMANSPHFYDSNNPSTYSPQQGYQQQQQQQQCTIETAPSRQKIPHIVIMLCEACSTCDDNDLKTRLSNTIDQEMMKWVTCSSQPSFINEENDLSCELLHLLCRLADLSLFHLVEWARQALFFRELQIDDQMKLLQSSWSQLLVLHFLYRQVHNDKREELVLVSGHSISFDFIRRMGLSDWISTLTNATKKFQSLNIDEYDLACLRYLVLLEPDVNVTIDARLKIDDWQDRVSQGLQVYSSLSFHMNNKYEQLILMLPELKQLAVRCENYLFKRNLNGHIKEHNLLMEMLHSQRS